MTINNQGTKIHYARMFSPKENRGPLHAKVAELLDDAFTNEKDGYDDDKSAVQTSIRDTPHDTASIQKAHQSAR
jgi:hypothetical protein